MSAYDLRGRGAETHGSCRAFTTDDEDSTMEVFQSCVAKHDLTEGVKTLDVSRFIDEEDQHDVLMNVTDNPLGRWCADRSGGGSLRELEEEDADDEPPPLEYVPLVEELTECSMNLVSINVDDYRCVRTAATLKAEKMVSAGFTLGSKKIADLEIEADRVDIAASQQDVEVPSASTDVLGATLNLNVVSADEQDEHMVYESLTDTSSDSDESGGYEIIVLTSSSDDESSDDDGNEEGERLCTPVNGSAVPAEALISDPDWSSDSDDDFLEIPGPIPEGEFVKWIGRTARRRLGPILSQAQP